MLAALFTAQIQCWQGVWKLKVWQQPGPVPIDRDRKVRLHSITFKYTILLYNTILNTLILIS